MAIFSSSYSPGNCVPIILTKANGKKAIKKGRIKSALSHFKNSKHL
jgi:hypothetical protein